MGNILRISLNLCCIYSVLLKSYHFVHNFYFVTFFILFRLSLFYESIQNLIAILMFSILVFLLMFATHTVLVIRRRAVVHIDINWLWNVLILHASAWGLVVVQRTVFSSRRIRAVFYLKSCFGPVCLLGCGWISRSRIRPLVVTMGRLVVCHWVSWVVSFC